MISRAILVFTAVSLAACAPQIPDSGVGFSGGYGSYGAYGPPEGQTVGASSNNVISNTQQAQVWSPSSAAAAIDRAQGINNSPSLYNSAPSLVEPDGYQPTGFVTQSQPIIPPVAGGTIVGPQVSDENDFKAVAARESIESDASRIAQNRAQYVVVQPKDLPQRTGSTGPNIVEYALRTTNVPGQPMFSRSRFFAKDAVTACAQYTSSDLAQQAFLAAGGPERDKLGVDPDGDGFACAWDPRSYRTALQ